MKTIVLNSTKMNFDGKLDFSILSDEVIVYDDTTPDELLERVDGADKPPAGQRETDLRSGNRV